MINIFKKDSETARLIAQVAELKRHLDCERQTVSCSLRNEAAAIRNSADLRAQIQVNERCIFDLTVEVLKLKAEVKALRLSND